MKYFSECAVAVTLAFGVLTLAAIDAHAKVVCGPNGCHRVYPYRSQWPVGQPGKYYKPRPGAAPWSAASEFVTTNAASVSKLRSSNCHAARQSFKRRSG